jgi:hypothetical protein
MDLFIGVNKLTSQYINQKNLELNKSYFRQNDSAQCDSCPEQIQQLHGRVILHVLTFFLRFIKCFRSFFVLRLISCRL